VTLYVNGDITTDADFVTSGAIPSNLKIFQLGTDRTFTAEKDIHLVAEVQAPGSDFYAKNNAYLSGSGIYKTITVKNNAEFYFDENADSANSAYASITLVK
jgi:hypothetical protein